MVFSNNLLMGAAGQATGYEIDQSIRFNNDDSPVMSRSFGTPTDRDKFTYAFWMKSTNQANGCNLSVNVTGGVTWASMNFNGGNMAFYDYTGGSANIDVRTTFTSNVGKFRDYNAWYHAVFAYDSDQGTAADRLKFYISGVQFPSASLVGPSGGSAVFPSSGFDSKINASGNTHTISDNVNGKLDGYMAEIYFIDGQALDPTSFGEFNTSGVFVPIEYSGAFGDNGFFIDGRDSSDLGDDESGNGNDFSTSGLAANDQMIDSPTNNSSIFNSLGSCEVSGQTLTLSDGNLRTSAGGTTNAIEAVTGIAPTAGKYYAEFTLNAAPQLSNQYPAIGIIGVDLNITGGNNLTGSTFFGYLPSGVKKNNNSDTSYGDSFGNGDVIGIALDLDNQKIYFSKNGTYQNSGDPAAGSNAAFTNLVAGTEYRFCVSHAGSSATDVTGNFGASAFATAAPTGFKALNTSNIPTPTITDGSKHFDTKLWTGNDTDGRAITGYNFSPDWVWIKSTTGAYSHNLTDAVRGAGNYLQTNTTDAEVDGPGAFGSTLAFTSDGFTLDNGTYDNLFVNAGGETYAGWAWKANGSGSSNEDGSINTTATSANTTAGFSISTYTGTGSNATVGHGLGATPSMIILHRRDSTGSWRMYNKNLTDASYVLNMESSGAQEVSATVWNSTDPTSTVFSIGTNAEVNASGGTYVAYCFAEIPGYSSIGSYTGNGSAASGPFIYTGFQPAYVVTKNITNSGDFWPITDTVRQSFSIPDAALFVNSHIATATGYSLNIVSNGFKPTVADHAVNESGATYIYWAFARHPFGGSGIAPATGGFITA